MTEEKLLMTPGPTPVPQNIAETMSKPIIHHRTPEYRGIFKDVSKNLKDLFKTKNDCLVFASSGTGSMEASVINILSAGDKAIAVRGGKFGERYYDICKAYGIDVIAMDVEWGTSPDIGRLSALIKENRGVKAVFTELCETSTATVFDIKAIGGVTKSAGVALVVDAISGLGADNIETDAWGVDIAVSGSQKALMLPPGLSFCSVSPRAWEMVESSKIPKYYYDFKKYKKSKETGDTPFTPAITLTIGLKKALDLIQARGVENVLADCKAMADTVRGAAKALNLEIYSKSPSNAVTALKMPEAVDSGAIVKALRERDIIVANGQAQLKGKIIRIAHMGGITPKDVERTINALREVCHAN